MHALAVSWKKGAGPVIASAAASCSAERVTASLHESLARLQTSYVDIIHVHDMEFGDLDQVAWGDGLRGQHAVPAVHWLLDRGLDLGLRRAGFYALPINLD